MRGPVPQCRRTGAATLRAHIDALRACIAVTVGIGFAVPTSRSLCARGPHWPAEGGRMRLESRITRWISDVATVVITLLATSTGAAAATASLSVSLAATPDAEVYTATIANAGPDAATNVVLTATLPSGIIPISVAPSPACAFNFPGTLVTCSLGSIPNGGSAI